MFQCFTTLHSCQGKNRSSLQLEILKNSFRSIKILKHVKEKWKKRRHKWMKRLQGRRLGRFSSVSRGNIKTESTISCFRTFILFQLIKCVKKMLFMLFIGYGKITKTIEMCCEWLRCWFSIPIIMLADIQRAALSFTPRVTSLLSWRQADECCLKLNCVLNKCKMDIKMKHAYKGSEEY